MRRNNVFTKTVKRSVVIKIWIRMARRVSKTGHKSSKNHCTEISGVVLFFIVVILIVFLYVWFNTGPSNDFACAESETTPIENAVLQKDGSYLDRTGLVYPVGYYFRVNGTLRGCTCILKPCTRKCCNADGAISRETNKCVTNNDSSPFDLPNLKTYRMINSVPTEINVSRNHFTQLYGEVCQHGKFQLMPEYSPSDVSYLMTDGALYYLNTFQNTAQYCLDTFTDNSTIITLVCFPPDEDAPTTTTFRLYSSGMFISLPFLFLTFLVYSLLSELQNLHGKSLMCYVLTLFFAYLVLGIIQMYGNSLVHTCCVTFVQNGTTSCTENSTETKKTSKSYWLIGGIVLLVVASLSFPVYYWISHRTIRVDCSADLSVVGKGERLRDGSYRDHDGTVYREGYYFDANGTTRVCNCVYKPCIRKCCPPDQAFSTESETCVQSTSIIVLHLNVPVYEKKSPFQKPKKVNVSADHFNYVYGDVCLYGRFLLTPDTRSTDISYLLTDGTILNSGRYFTTSDYCMEVQNGNTTVYTLLCFPPDEEVEAKAAVFTLYPIGMMISLPFLLLTFLVYAIIPDLQNLHGKSLMCHAASLFCAYLFLVIIQIGKDAVDLVYCISFSFIVQFSFLASFFWLNVMCFDIWWVFSGLRPLRGSVKEREHKKFIIYSVYAWGWALAIFIVTLVMQTVESIPDTYVKPEFGVGKCWFRTDAATFWYFYFPIIILVVLNIIMFVTTAFQIRAHTRETEVLNRGESRRHDENEKQRYNLYLKLFIVMGVNWVNWELVSWIVGGEKKLWYVTDIAYTLQGVLIFLIFVWKRRILRLLNNKLCPKLQLVPMTTSSTRSKVNPSRTTTSSLKQTPSNNINTAPDSVSLKKMNSNV